VSYSRVSYFFCTGLNYNNQMEPYFCIVFS